ncbi:MAG: DUF72 domain-containing protein [Caulobacteraceae bacterium]|nr:DUF72 domain-containing protein [Caulobacteraceae bacterium]
MAGRIRAGIGGWTFAPWRGVFYPQGTRQADELAFASRHVTVIEINATYYSTFKPATFAGWAAQTPEDFVFAVKASRFCTNRKALGEAGPSVERFLGQGLAELGDRLGPIVWQFMPTKKYDPDDFTGFFALLPKTLEGLPLRHCLEVRHPSFADPSFVAQCRDHGVAICLADHETYPLIPDVAADFVYARLMTGRDDIETAYEDAGLGAWAKRFEAFARGDAPAGLAPVDAGHAAPKADRDVFAFFIHAGKVRAPAAAMALLKRLEA